MSRDPTMNADLSFPKLCRESSRNDASLPQLWVSLTGNGGRSRPKRLFLTFLLAHLSDAHIGPIPRPNLAELLGKRVTGYVNWLYKRADQHDMGVLGTSSPT